MDAFKIASIKSITLTLVEGNNIASTPVTGYYIFLSALISYAGDHLTGYFEHLSCDS